MAMNIAEICVGFMRKQAAREPASVKAGTRAIATIRILHQKGPRKPIPNRIQSGMVTNATSDVATITRSAVTGSPP